MTRGLRCGARSQATGRLLAVPDVTTGPFTRWPGRRRHPARFRGATARNEWDEPQRMRETVASRRPARVAGWPSGHGIELVRSASLRRFCRLGSRFAATTVVMVVVMDLAGLLGRAGRRTGLRRSRGLRCCGLGRGGLGRVLRGREITPRRCGGNSTYAHDKLLFQIMPQDRTGQDINHPCNCPHKFGIGCYSEVPSAAQPTGKAGGLSQHSLLHIVKILFRFRL